MVAAVGGQVAAERGPSRANCRCEYVSATSQNTIRERPGASNLPIRCREPLQALAHEAVITRGRALPSG